MQEWWESLPAVEWGLWVLFPRLCMRFQLNSHWIKCRHSIRVPGIPHEEVLVFCLYVWSEPEIVILWFLLRLPSPFTCIALGAESKTTCLLGGGRPYWPTGLGSILHAFFLVLSLLYSFSLSTREMGAIYIVVNSTYFGSWSCGFTGWARPVMQISCFLGECHKY